MFCQNSKPARTKPNHPTAHPPNFGAGYIAIRTGYEACSDTAIFIIHESTPHFWWTQRVKPRFFTMFDAEVRPPCTARAELMSILRSPELLLNVTGNFCDQNFDDEACRVQGEWDAVRRLMCFPNGLYWAVWPVWPVMVTCFKWVWLRCTSRTAWLNSLMIQERPIPKCWLVKPSREERSEGPTCIRWTFQQSWMITFHGFKEVWHV